MFGIRSLNAQMGRVRRRLRPRSVSICGFSGTSYALLFNMKLYFLLVEAEDEDFAREKADIMSEIETLEQEDPSYTLRASPSMNSRDIASFRNMSFSTLNASRHARDDDSQPILEHGNGSSASLQAHVSGDNSS
jgi:hypothetical protein